MKADQQDDLTYHRDRYNDLLDRIEKWELSIEKARRSGKFGKIPGFREKIEAARKEMIEVDLARFELYSKTKK